MNLWLRLTEDPELDIERRSSVHLTDASTVPEAVEWYGEGEGEDYVVLENGRVALVLPGLCCFYLKATNIEEALLEASSMLNLDANSATTNTRKAYIFEGEACEENDLVGDGFLFWPTGKYWPVKN